MWHREKRGEATRHLKLWKDHEKVKASRAFAKTAGPEGYEGLCKVMSVESSPEVPVPWGYMLHMKGSGCGMDSLPR